MRRFPQLDHAYTRSTAEFDDARENLNPKDIPVRFLKTGSYLIIG